MSYKKDLEQITIRTRNLGQLLDELANDMNNISISDNKSMSLDSFAMIKLLRDMAKSCYEYSDKMRTKLECFI